MTEPNALDHTRGNTITRGIFIRDGETCLTSRACVELLAEPGKEAMSTRSLSTSGITRYSENISDYPILGSHRCGPRRAYLFPMQHFLKRFGNPKSITLSQLETFVKKAKKRNQIINTYEALPNKRKREDGNQGKNNQPQAKRKKAHDDISSPATNKTEKRKKIPPRTKSRMEGTDDVKKRTASNEHKLIQKSEKAITIGNNSTTTEDSTLAPRPRRPNESVTAATQTSMVNGTSSITSRTEPSLIILDSIQQQIDKWTKRMLRAEVKLQKATKLNERADKKLKHLKEAFDAMTHVTDINDS